MSLKAEITLKVTQDDQPYHDASLVYHNLEYGDLITIEGALIEAVKALHRAGQEQAAAMQSTK